MNQLKELHGIRYESQATRGHSAYLLFILLQYYKHGGHADYRGGSNSEKHCIQIPEN
jgi:hypothetical protein